MRLSQRIRKLTFPLRFQANRLRRPKVWLGGPPSGLFSEELNVRSGKIEGKIIRHGQHLPAIPRDSEILTAGLDQGRFSDWVSLWARRDNAFLASSSLAHIDNSGRVCREAVYGPQAWSDPVWQRSRPQPIRDLAGDFTSIVSRWNRGENYYHWFLDGLTRLANLPDFPPECRILIPEGIPDFAKRSLQLLGLADQVVETRCEDLRIERYWFSGPTMVSGCPDPLGVQWLREQFLTAPPPKRHRKLYLERRAPTRKLTNASEVRDLFKKQGWDVVDPSELSLDEQIQIFRESWMVAGVHGAALTNLLWTAPGTRVIELMPSRRRNGCYAGLALVAGLSHQSLVCASNRMGDFEASLEKIHNLLKTNYQ
jgi:hypothetical protein